jgi:hypothetical protein
MLLEAPEKYKLVKLVEEVLTEAKSPFKRNMGMIYRSLKTAQQRPEDFIFTEPQRRVFKQIEQLTTNKVVKALKPGRFGLPFILDNDHVLKFFTAGTGEWGEDFGSAESAKQDIAFYKALQDAQFSGTGTAAMPAIYDFGEVDGLYYVEMGKVLPLMDYLRLGNPNLASAGVSRVVKFVPHLILRAMKDLQVQQMKKTNETAVTQTQTEPDFDTTVQDDATAPDPYAGRVAATADIFDMLAGTKKIPQLAIDPEEFATIYKQVGGFANIAKQILSYNNRSLLSDEQLLSLCKAWLDAFIASGRRSIDVTHAGNVGVSLQNPKHWVVFDI